MALSILNHPAQLILSNQPVGFTVQTTDAGSIRRIKANVSGSDDADSIAADSEGKASFEMSDYLQGLITTRHKTGDVAVKYTDVPALVSFNFQTLVGNPPNAGSELATGYYFLLDGFVPKLRRKSLYSQYANLLEYLQDKRCCLTWFPYSETKQVSKDQKEFINFMQVFDLENPCDLRVNIILNLDDGTTRVMVDVFSALNVNPFEILYIPVGYTQLGIEQYLYNWNQENDTWIWAKSYTVYIYNSALDLLSQKYTFEIDEKYTQNARTLYIRNPFGLLEIVKCTGITGQDNNLKLQTARTDGKVLPDRINWKIDRTYDVKVNTGFMTSAQLQWLSDMDFTEAYELISGNLVPIVFGELKFPVIHDGDYQYSAEMEYEYAYNEITEHA